MNPANEHEQKLTLSIDILDPDHGNRKAEGETDIYRASRHLLVDVQKQCCFICGTRQQLETHHQFVEWYQANGVDFSPGSELRQDHPDFDWEGFDKAGGDPAFFVDSAYNLLVLCKKHHTGKDHGIHMLPHGIWLYQKYKIASEVFSPDELQTMQAAS
jgi:hypothetical protein